MLLRACCSTVAASSAQRVGPLRSHVADRTKDLTGPDSIVLINIAIGFAAVLLLYIHT